MKKLNIIYCCFLFVGCGKPPVSNFTWSPQSPQAGQEVVFENLSTNSKSYSWNLGDMNISSEKNPKHIYKKAGQYIVDLNAHRGLSSDIKTVTITVKP